MKKLFLILFLSAFSVACSSMQSTSGEGSEKNNSPIQDPMTGLATTKVDQEMTPDDRKQLKSLVAYSKTKEVKTWKTSGDYYEFTSLNIYVNNEGKPCRQYQLKTLEGGRDHGFQATACRQEDASWEVTQESQL